MMGLTDEKELTVFDNSHEVAGLDTPTNRLDEINQHCKKEFLEAEDPKDKERAFKMYMISHTVMAADEGASEEALVRNFLLSKPGLMSLLKTEENMRRVYGAFENHIAIHGAHHLLLSPEGFVAQLKRIAQKANKSLARYTGKPGYFKEKKR